MTVLTRTKEQPGFPGGELLLVSGGLLPLVHTSVLTHWDSKSPSCDSPLLSQSLLSDGLKAHSQVICKASPLPGKVPYYPGVSQGTRVTLGQKRAVGAFTRAEAVTTGQAAAALHPLCAGHCSKSVYTSAHLLLSVTFLK